MRTNEAPRLYSLAHVSTMLATPAHLVLIGAESANVSPALYLNEIAYFEKQALNKIKAAVSGQKKPVATSRRKSKD